MVLNCSVESNDCDEEEENATGNDTTHDVQAGDHVRRFAVSRNPDQEKRDHLKQIFIVKGAVRVVQRASSTTKSYNSISVKSA